LSVAEVVEELAGIASAQVAVAVEWFSQALIVFLQI
jgi:hypothetical protein